jgi:hypothetical protein
MVLTKAVSACGGLGALSDFKSNKLILGIKMGVGLARLCAIGLATCALLCGVPAKAAVDLALLSEGASFVSASSATIYAQGNFCCGGPVNGGLTTMQNDILTNTPVPWLANGDTRYIFGQNDFNQWIEISLGSIKSVTSFGVTFSPTDRAVIGPFYVETSTDGTNFAQQGGVVLDPASSASLITLASPIQAEYIKFFFGPTSPQYNSDGSGVEQVFASGVPELSTWAMLILGFIGIALLACRRQNSATGAGRVIRVFTRSA